MIYKLSKIPTLSFEGNWVNNDNSLMFPVNFDNKNKLK